MSTDAASVADVYAEKFDNFSEVAHPAIAFDPRFDGLMQRAVDRNSPLTQAEVEAEFGPQAWEW